MAGLPDIDPQLDKVESLGSYDGWNITNADSSVVGYANKAYVTVLAPQSPGPGGVTNPLTLDLAAKILRAFAALGLTPEQDLQMTEALSGYLSGEPTSLRNLTTSAAQFVVALEKRDGFLLEALQGLMQATANPKGQ